MKRADELGLDSKMVGALPIINHFMDLMEVDRIFGQNLPNPANMKFSHKDALKILLRDILIEREPIYQIREWASSHDPILVGLGNVPIKILNDDRIGRSLDTLFLADRASMMTDLVVTAVRKFNVDLSQIHNDSTTVTLTGQYDAPTKLKGKSSIKPKHVTNKDHRPDLKQLLYTLSVSRDGAVPVHYKTYDGNVTDDSTHIQTWETLRKISGRNDFTYVADCKLCTRSQMDHINKEGGRFVTVMPRSRAEDKWFRAWLRKNRADWQEIMRKPRSGQPDDHDDVYWGIESPIPSSDGFRIIWVLSSQKRDQDELNRQGKIARTVDHLGKIKAKVGSHRLKTKEQITDAIIEVFEKNSSHEWFDWQVICSEVEDYKQVGMGRPGRTTRYEKIVRKVWSFEAFPNEEKVQTSAMDDGIFPLITNHRAESLSMRRILEIYKYQPYLEKRHQQFKTVFDAMPVWIKLPYRIEALLFLYFVVLMVNALIEREIRRAMKEREISSLPLYPEQRKCKQPATERILAVFKNHRRHILKTDNNILKTFKDPLTDVQRLVLDLLGVPKDAYA